MAFEQNLYFDSNIYDLIFYLNIHTFENNSMNPPSNNVFFNEQVYFDSLQQIPVNYKIQNSYPRVDANNNERLLQNPLTQKFLEDLLMEDSCNKYSDDSMGSPFAKIYNELSDLIKITSKCIGNSTNFEESSNSGNSCLHGDKIKKMKKRKTNSGIKVRWSAKEDKILIKLVKEFGNKSWNFLARKMSSGRTGNQLRERYNNHLRPGLKKQVWSEEDDLKLIKAHENLGNKWVEIAKMIPGRSESDIKNRWNATKRRCLNAIKKINIPKSSSLFENYVESIVQNKNLKTSISVESNAIPDDDDDNDDNWDSLKNLLDSDE